MSDITMKIDGGCGSSGNKRDCSNFSNRIKREATREKMIDWTLLNLGAPILEIQLDQRQLFECTEQTFMIAEQYASLEFFEYLVLSTVPGKSIYEMPAEVDVIRAVHYRQLPINNSYSTSLGGVLPYGIDSTLGSYGGFGGFGGVQPFHGGLSDFVLSNQYNKMYNQVSSGLGGWEWIRDTHTIKIFPTPCGSCDEIIVHYLQTCKDWETSTLLLEGCLAFAMIMYGRILSRYPILPGPQGGIQISGSAMLEEGLQAKAAWEERLIRRWGGLLGITTG